LFFLNFNPSGNYIEMTRKRSSSNWTARDVEVGGNGGHGHENPVERANFLSQLFLIWILPLFRKGFGTQLTPEDIPDPPTQEACGGLAEKLQK
jgi:hypothetical protein